MTNGTSLHGWRRGGLILGALAVASLLLSGSAAIAQRDFSQVEVGTVPLGNGMALLQGAGGNVAVLYGPEGVLLVDDEYEAMNEKMRAAIAALSSEPIRYVINTHWHGDHSGGNASLGKAGATLVAHENVRLRMSQTHVSQISGQTIPASPAEALPGVTYQDGLRLHLNGETIDVRHVDPAHTDGDSVIHFQKADVVHLGDTYFAGIYPYVDISTGGSIDGLIAAADKALAMAGPRTRIIPGHGPLSSPKDLAAWRKMLVDVRERVRKLIDQGKNRAETVAAQPTWSLDAEWGKGFLKGDDFAGLVYDSLTAQDGD